MPQFTCIISHPKGLGAQLFLVDPLEKVGGGVQHNGQGYRPNPAQIRARLPREFRSLFYATLWTYSFDERSCSTILIKPYGDALAIVCFIEGTQE